MGEPAVAWKTALNAPAERPLPAAGYSPQLSSPAHKWQPQISARGYVGAGEASPKQHVAAGQGQVEAEAAEVRGAQLRRHRWGSVQGVHSKGTPVLQRDVHRRFSCVRHT